VRKGYVEFERNRTDKRAESEPKQNMVRVLAGSANSYVNKYLHLSQWSPVH